jgi:hypothetical protein
MHDRACPGSEPIVLVCEHSTTVVFVCDQCQETVFGVFAPGVPCIHAAEVRDGRDPSGPWREVAA